MRETELGGVLEAYRKQYWGAYVAECEVLGHYPNFGDFLIYIDDKDLATNEPEFDDWINNAGL